MVQHLLKQTRHSRACSCTKDGCLIQEGELSLALYPGSRWEPGYEAKVESYCHLASPGNKASSHCKQFICLELGDQHRVQCRTALSILLHLLLLYFLTSPPHFLTQSSLSLSLSRSTSLLSLFLTSLSSFPSPPSPSSLITANNLWQQKYGLSSLSLLLVLSNRCFLATRGRCQGYQYPDWRTPAEG